MDSAQATIESIKGKITKTQLPQEVEEKLINLLKFPQSGPELEKLIAYIDFCLSLPFNKLSQDILDLHRAKEILDKNHFGLDSVKNRILEYLAVMILNKQSLRSDDL